MSGHHRPLEVVCGGAKVNCAFCGCVCITESPTFLPRLNRCQLRFPVALPHLMSVTYNIP
jgi:hypothetical protein